MIISKRGLFAAIIFINAVWATDGLANGCNMYVLHINNNTSSNWYFVFDRLLYGNLVETPPYYFYLSYPNVIVPGGERTGVELAFDVTSTVHPFYFDLKLISADGTQSADIVGTQKYCLLKGKTATAAVTRQPGAAHITSEVTSQNTYKNTASLSTFTISSN